MCVPKLYDLIFFQNFVHSHDKFCCFSYGEICFEKLRKGKLKVIILLFVDF